MLNVDVKINLVTQKMDNYGRLILGMYKDDVVFVGADVKIKVNKISPHKIELCFEAPKDCPIFREKVLEKENGKRRS